MLETNRKGKLQKDQKDCFDAFKIRIKDAEKDKESLKVLEYKIVRFFDIGLISWRQLRELDSMIVSRLVKIDVEGGIG